jgi:hypothetical protein
MKKLGISMVLVAISVLVVGIFTFIVVQEANAGTRVVSRTIRLPADGTDVAVEFIAYEDVIVYEIMMDNYPTNEAGLCNFTAGSIPGDPDTCEESDFRFLDLAIDGRAFRRGGRPDTQANDDNLGVRPLLSREFSDVVLPLKKRQKMRLLFDTLNGLNDVIITVTVGFTDTLGFGGTLR